MSFAIRKLQGFGLIMLVTFCVLFAYPLSLKVSATRAELQKVEQEIEQTRRRNRMLEGDIAVLANARQLDRWNREYLGYVAPSAGQYLAGERALANLDRIRPPADAAPAAPVLMAMRDDATPVRELTAQVNDNRSDDPEPQRIAMVDRGAVAEKALRDIARTASVGNGGGGR